MQSYGEFVGVPLRIPAGILSGGGSGLMRLSILSAYAFCAAAAGPPPALLNAAKHGDLDSQLQLAKYYQKAGDDRKAAVWLEKAGLQGSVEASYELGMEYQLSKLPPTRAPGDRVH